MPKANFAMGSNLFSSPLYLALNICQYLLISVNQIMLMYYRSCRRISLSITCEIINYSPTFSLQSHMCGGKFSGMEETQSSSGQEAKICVYNSKHRATHATFFIFWTLKLFKRTKYKNVFRFLI